MDGRRRHSPFAPADRADPSTEEKVRTVLQGMVESADGSPEVTTIPPRDENAKPGLSAI